VLSELAQARDLLGSANGTRALKLLERARKRALSDGVENGLREVLALGRSIAATTDGSRRAAAGRLVYAAEQNLRFLESRSAIGTAVEPPGPPTAGSLAGALVIHALIGATWLFVAVIAVGLGDPGRFGNGPTHADYVRALMVVAALWCVAALVMVVRWRAGRQPLFVSLVWFVVAIPAALIALS
jgi:hypothetical protein